MWLWIGEEGGSGRHRKNVIHTAIADAIDDKQSTSTLFYKQSFHNTTAQL